LFLADAGNIGGGEQTPLGAAIKLVIGLLLLFLAFRLWRERPSAGGATKTPGWMTTLDSFGPTKSFGLGTLFGGIKPKKLFEKVRFGTGDEASPGS
jgi:hypothetical protein